LAIVKRNFSLSSNKNFLGSSALSVQIRQTENSPKQFVITLFQAAPGTSPERDKASATPSLVQSNR
jgi:hypothetical protein